MPTAKPAAVFSRLLELPMLEDNGGKCPERWGPTATAENVLVPEIVSGLGCRKSALTSKLGSVPFNGDVAGEV